MEREHFRDKMSLLKRPVLLLNFVICIYQKKQVMEYLEENEWYYGLVFRENAAR